MAVKVHNTANIRRAQRWDERDDAALGVLLKRKIKDVTIGLRESENPYERAKLKEQKRHYKAMLRKVESGSYNGDIIFSELKASSALRAEQNLRAAGYSTMAGGKNYVNSYQAMDFDYESAFRKKRYYGVALPLLLLLLSIIFVGIFIMSAFLPSNIMDTMDSNGVPLDSMFMYKLGADTLDIEITNDGKFPNGVYENDKKPTQGEKYADSLGNVPETVRLNADLGMKAIYISPFDVIKAWFRTPMLEKVRLDFLEDMSAFQGDSYYYLCFLSGNKRTALIIQKDEDGNFDRSVIFRHIGAYGLIMFLIAAFIFGVINILINIIRLFTYTSRRLHAITFLSFIFSLLCLICPAFATVEGTEIGAAFSGYFSAMTDVEEFLKNPDASAGIGILFLLPAAINLIMLLLPKLMRNKLKRLSTFVPRGNKGRNPLDDPLYVDEETLRSLR